MKITVIRPSELGRAEVARWRSFTQATPALANPFLAPEFTVVVGGLRPQARVAVLSDGSEIVGFFPFERQRLGYGAPICAGHNDCQGLVHAPGLDWDPQQLLDACGLAVWEFDHLVEGQRPFGPYLSSHVPSPIMDLAAGFDPFVAQLREGPNRLRTIARKHRKLARDVGEVRFDFDSADHHLLHTVLAWKSAQYLRTGWTDRFARQWIVELLERLLALKTAEFSGVLSMLYVGDEPVAGHFGIRSDTVLAHWFPAYDSRYGEYSPGLTMHLELAEGAAAGGIRYIDLGPGPDDYKQWFRSRDLMVGAGAVLRGSRGGAMQWMRRAPAKQLYRTLDKNPSLHRVARRVRTRYGRVDAALRRRAVAEGPDGNG